MIVLCPLDFEASALRSAAARHGWRVLRTGPGEGPAAWLRRSGLAPGSVVVLAGVAAGLQAPAHAGTAWAAASVWHRGTRLEPTLPLPHAPAAALACVEVVLHTPADKAATATKSGALLACMESGHFARQAQAMQLRWAVVRGVSDGPAHALPAAMATWTDATGRTRKRVVAASVLRNPRLLRDMARCGWHGKAAMRAVAQLLAAADNAHSP